MVQPIIPRSIDVQFCYYPPFYRCTVLLFSTVCIVRYFHIYLTSIVNPEVVPISSTLYISQPFSVKYLLIIIIIDIPIDCTLSFHPPAIISILQYNKFIQCLSPVLKPVVFRFNNVLHFLRSF